ncbi:MAG: hypothetical protein Q9171_003466 [Xanthocarpia ochracea]
MDLVRRHLSRIHHVKNDRQTWLRDDVRDGLSLQSWTQNGQREYWIVANKDQPGLASTTADATCSPRRRRRVADLHEDQHRRIAADAQSRSTTDLGPDDLALTSYWMRRTNWAATFTGADRLLLLLLTDRPAASGHHLPLGRRTIVRYRLQQNLESSDKVDGSDSSWSSFDETSLDEESGSAYSEEASDSDETKDSVHAAMLEQAVRKRTQGMIPAPLKCMSLSLPANDVGAASSHSSTTPNTREEELADLIGRLSVFFCTEEFTDSRSSSTIIVYFSGVLGFSPSGTTFKRPRNYTPKLSALIYCIRLCLLEASLPRFTYPFIGWKARALGGNLKRLNRIRERFMCLSCQAPMGELLSLRSYGRAISRSDGPSFRVQWSDDSEVVMWDGAELSINHFRQLGCYAVQTATILIAQLMYGVRLISRLDSISDSISNVAQGYSFVQDPANGLATAHLDLSTRACLDPLDGLMMSERWNTPAVYRYLKKEADLLIQLMLIMYLRGGQAPRLTELFSIECYNGPSISRGVYVHAGAIVYVTRHSKARRLTNQEFQVARYLSHRDSELVA